jgi:hypothetical protein
LQLVLEEVEQMELAMVLVVVEEVQLLVLVKEAMAAMARPESA